MFYIRYIVKTEESIAKRKNNLKAHFSKRDPLSVRSEFFFWGGVASRVPWGWCDSYGKTGNFGRVGDKSMFKMYKKAGVGREGDI